MRAGPVVPLAAALAATLLSSAAAARVHYAGPNELSGHILLQAGLDDDTPGGFKFFHEYGYQLSDLTWFNAQLNWALGDDRDCVRVGNRIVCDDDQLGGKTLELGAGVKLKFNRLRIPLLPYAKLGGAVEYISYGNDLQSVAFGFRGGGGVKYFFRDNFGVGGELLLTVGPLLGDIDGAYAAFDFAGGVEFLF